jgi:hypothetical protein
VEYEGKTRASVRGMNALSLRCWRAGRLTDQTDKGRKLVFHT